MTWGSFWWQILLIVAGSYLIGNISWATIISKFRKHKIQDEGSGNPGTMNMIRTFGIKIGVLTLFLDVLKGAIPAIIVKLIYNGITVDGFFVSDMFIYIAGLSAVLGHIYPVFMRFKGGKGIATTMGVYLVCEPVITLIIFVFAVIYILIFEYGSVGSLIITTGMAIQQAQVYTSKYAPDKIFISSGVEIPLFVLCLLIFAINILIWIAHRKNIYRLILGREHKTRLAKMIKKINKKNAKIEAKAAIAQNAENNSENGLDNINNSYDNEKDSFVNDNKDKEEIIDENNSRE